MTTMKTFGSICALVGFASAHTLASAQQVVISYAPASTAVPTVSEWGMIILSLLLVVAAVLAMRKGANGKTVLGIALAATVSLGGGSHVIKDALAAVLPDLSMTNAAGGVVTAPEGSIPVPVTNQTSVPMRILSITPPTAVDTDPSGCVSGSTVVAPGASCTVLVGVGGSGPF